MRRCRKAVADARGRADAAAAGAGLHVDRVLRIEEQRAVPIEPRPVMMARQSMVADAGTAPPIAPGELEVRTTVTHDGDDQIGSTASSTISASINDSWVGTRSSAALGSRISM